MPGKLTGQGLRRALEAMEREAEARLEEQLREAEAARDHRQTTRVRRALS